MTKNKKQIYSVHRFAFCFYIKGSSNYSRKINSIYTIERLHLSCYGPDFSTRYTSLDDLEFLRRGHVA